MGAFFVKLLAASPTVLSRNLRLIEGEPPAHARLFSDQLKCYLVAVFKYNRPQKSEGEIRPSTKVCDRFKLSLDKYFSVFNGGNAALEDDIPHYTGAVALSD
eukprot:1572109-Karenia_brevis.AAC.1